MNYLIASLLIVLTLSGCTQKSNPVPKSETNKTGDIVSDLSVEISSLETLPDGLILDGSSPLDIGTISATVKSVQKVISLQNKSSNAIPVALSGLSDGFVIKLNRCANSVPAKKKCDITIQFNPRSAYNGDYTSALTINGYVLNVLAKVTETPDPNGEEAGDAAITTSLDSPFTLGGSPYRTLTIKNEGTATAKNLNAQIPQEYQIRSNRCPTMLKPKFSCSMQVQFKNFRSLTEIPAPVAEDDFIQVKADNDPNISTMNPQQTTSVPVPQNKAPIINSISLVNANGFGTQVSPFLINANQPLSLSVSATDANNDPLTFSLATPVLGASISGSTLSFNSEVAGLIAITVLANDGKINSDPYSVFFSINKAPTVRSGATLSYQTNEDTSLNIDLTTIFEDEGDILSYSVGSNPDISASTLLAQLSLTPNLNWFGSTSVLVTATDSRGASVQSNLNISVLPINDPPFSLPQNLSMTMNEDPLSGGVGELIGQDPEGNTITYIIVSNPVGGSFTRDEENFTYFPPQNFNGVKTFQYKMIDQHGAESPVYTYSIIINPVDDEPIIAQSYFEDTLIVNKGGNSYQINVTDVDDDGIVYSTQIQPQFGQVTISSSGLVTYVPNGTETGIDNFSITVSDGVSEMWVDFSLTIRIPIVNKLANYGYQSNCAIRNDKAYCWGENTNGQLGRGTTGTGSNVPLLVNSTGVLAGKVIKDISAGNVACVIAGSSYTDANDRVYCWGGGGQGQIGHGVNNVTAVPNPVAVLTNGVLNGKIPKKVVTSFNRSCVLTKDEMVYCWGSYPGNGTSAGTANPVAVSMTGPLVGKTVKDISENCLIASDDKLYCWGNSNASGFYGNGTTSTTVQLTPVPSGTTGAMAGKTVKQATSKGNTACAVANDDKLYCWGSNPNGMMGIGSNTTNQLNPISVHSGLLTTKNVKQVVIDSSNICTLTTDNLIYCAGAGTWGQNGSGSATTTNVWAQVVNTGSLLGKTISSISNVYQTFCATDSLFSSYCWGWNYLGQLGTNTVTSGNVTNFSTTPVLVQLPAIVDPPY